MLHNSAVSSAQLNVGKSVKYETYIFTSLKHTWRVIVIINIICIAATAAEL